MAEIRARMTLSTFEEAKTAVEDFCQRNDFPIRVDKRKTMSSFNSEAKEENRVTDKPADNIYSYQMSEGFGDHKFVVVTSQSLF